MHPRAGQSKFLSVKSLVVFILQPDFFRRFLCVKKSDGSLNLPIGHMQIFFNDLQVFFINVPHSRPTLSFEQVKVCVNFFYWTSSRV